MATRDELLDALANRLLEVVQALNRVSALLAPAAKHLHDLVQARELDHHQLLHELRQVNERFAVQGERLSDVKREVTGTFRTHEKEKTPEKVTLLRAFDQARPLTRVLVFVLLLALAAFGGGVVKGYLPH